MNKEKLTRQLELLHSDLNRANNRCNRISKSCDIEPNELITYAMEQAADILEYIKELKDKEND